MPFKYLDIKEVPLNNNCPECYNTNGLHLLFKQKAVETSLYKGLTSEINHELNCKTCNTTIYPGQWTTDIDRVVDYQNKAFVPKPAFRKLKKLAWMLIIGATTLISASLFLAVYLNL
ncbi:hypothetical protein [Tamlana sp. I1]|uniref:hypothetical protein n=1 Tax=Tamlana sp. I1 TaxID=2762061 RepID=UPI00188EE1F7|nr:hypothetical protein [Tamlana sp. I1]